jgi:biopolymer transport protein ExbD
MAMNGPSGGDETEAEAGGIFADINITPLTDIFLVLLIIFMVTTTAIAEAGGQNGGLRVNLPRGASLPCPPTRGPPSSRTAAVVGDVVDEDTLARIPTRRMGRTPETLVLVQADQGSPMQGGAVMELARAQARLARLAIATRDTLGRGHMAVRKRLVRCL